MSPPDTVGHDAPYGIDYLQRRLIEEFPLARHLGVGVEAADDATIVLRAPFAPNANDKGTAFGGSQFSVAVLAGWAWVARYTACHQLATEAVIQESNIRYLAPVRGELRAVLNTPRGDSVEKFRQMLSRAGRGRIRLEVELREGDTLATAFDGVYAAMSRQAATGR
jgi:thioesterase domain-containing protein